MTIHPEVIARSCRGGRLQRPNVHIGILFSGVAANRQLSFSWLSLIRNLLEFCRDTAPRRGREACQRTIAGA